jgi:hypothetical protein
MLLAWHGSEVSGAQIVNWGGLLHDGSQGFLAENSS